MKEEKWCIKEGLTVALDLKELSEMAWIEI